MRLSGLTWVTKTHQNSASFPTPSSFLSSRWFLWDRERFWSLSSVGDDSKKNIYHLSFKCPSQKNCYTNHKFQFLNFYCQIVLKWINFLFKEKELARAEGNETISSIAGNFNEYCNFLKIQKAKPSAEKWHDCNEVGWVGPDDFVRDKNLVHQKNRMSRNSVFSCTI